MKKDNVKPIEIKHQPLTLEAVIGWVEDLEERIDRIEKLLGRYGIEEPGILR